MNYLNADELRKKCAACLRELANLAATHPALDLATRKLSERAASAEGDLFTLMVVGSFSRGKSTFLNAMVGAEVLPEEMVPSTAVISVLRHGERPKAVVQMRDGLPAETLTLEEFKARYILETTEDSQDHNGQARDRFSIVDYAEVYTPTELLRLRVQLVDSPGTEDDKARTERARDFVSKADALIYLLDPTQPVTDSDLEHLDWIRDNGGRVIFFVANKWDIAEMQARGNEEKLQKVKTRFREKLAAYTTTDGVERYNERFFPVSALRAKNARLQSPQNLQELVGSGLPAVETALEKFLTHDAVRARQTAILADARLLTQQMEHVMEREESMLHKSVAELEAVRLQIQPILERLRAVVRHISEYLQAREEVIFSRVVESLRLQMRAINARAEVDRFNLSELTDKWLALEALKDIRKDEEDKLANRIERQIKPQVNALLLRERGEWERNSVAITMRDESLKLREYLEREAELYRHALEEIDTLLGNDSHARLPVSELVEGWLQQTVLGRQHVGGVSVAQGAGLALDFTPMVAGLAFEMLIHSKMAFLTFGMSAVISAALAMWRQAKMVENVKRGIADGLQAALLEIPSPAQAAEFRQKLADAFGGLREGVTGNMLAEVGQIERNLEIATTRKKQREDDVAAETARLNEIRTQMNGHMHEIERLCTTQMG